MAKINGIEYKTLLVGEGSNAQNAPQIQFGGLYLDGKKLATVLLEKNIPDCEPSTQLFMAYGYSEKALRTALEADHGPGYTPREMIDEIRWLEGIEKEFKRHSAQRGGGMVALVYDNSQVTMGIPAQYAQASEEEILSVLAGKIRSSEPIYGPLQKHLVFHTEEDFNLGRSFTLEELEEK
jgi:hypothetical protein